MDYYGHSNSLLSIEEKLKVTETNLKEIEDKYIESLETQTLFIRYLEAAESKYREGAMIAMNCGNKDRANSLNGTADGIVHAVKVFSDIVQNKF